MAVHQKSLSFFNGNQAAFLTWIVDHVMLPADRLLDAHAPPLGLGEKSQSLQLLPEVGGTDDVAVFVVVIGVLVRVVDIVDVDAGQVLLAGIAACAEIKPNDEERNLILISTSDEGRTSSKHEKHEWRLTTTQY